MNDRSVTIIGGGLGGLVSGAILAKEGLRVTVLEKNPVVGGGLQNFTRFGEVFDTGMHIIGGMQKGGNVRRLFEYLGIFDRLHLSDVNPLMQDRIYFAEDNSTYRTAKGKENYIEALSESFPSQNGNIRRYVEALYRVAGEVDLFYLRPSAGVYPIHSPEFTMPATAFIAKYLTDERLRSVVAYMNPLYGGIENKTPAYVHALISVLYIEGQTRFAGGSQLCADMLRDFITECGGTVHTGSPVTKVTTCARHVSSVVTGNGERYETDYYVCAMHPTVFHSLLDDVSAVPKAYRERLVNMPESYSAFTLNMKLKAGTFPYLDHSAYYMKRYSDIWRFNRAGDNWPLGFLYMTPPNLNQGEYAGKMIVTAPMTWDTVRRWEDTSVGRRGREYEEWKEERASRLLSCIEEMYPGFNACIEAVNTASPLTIRDYYGVREGSMCGFAKDSDNLMLAQIPVFTKIPNLFLTGQGCNLHGFCGVCLTAINTCEAILGRNYILDRI